ncbi:MAG: uracil-DNA glycosylase, partial [Planctomycetes bacterium]|nr:uracil-DNA glycosylase [Planctomycetota bacterium]
GNRDPEAGEVGSCTPYLHEQLRIIRPKLIIALGRISGQILSGKRMSMKNLRGQFFQYRGIPLLPTYHPAYLLRQREREGRGNIADRNTWADLQMAMAFLADNK